ncbi:MAG: bacteriocin [Lachnospiraceae bacterium]|nr:bacteriocin [Lachnospiraceae bacterium]
MFKTLNQNEMMTVNGGFYYVPVYNRRFRKTTYISRTTHRVVGVETKLLSSTFVGTQQVASDSGISAIYHDSYTSRTVYVG